MSIRGYEQGKDVELPSLDARPALYSKPMVGASSKPLP